jgi:isoleucyl-tRNA synthetase
VIVVGHHVTTSAGTGIVHTAPAFGEDDMLVAKKTGLGILQWVEPSGRFAAQAGFVAGLFCKDADKPIIADLKARGLLFKRDTLRHDYPFCWRADSDPLIQYARPAWFIRTTNFVEEALRNNGEVKWFPDHIQEGRFGDFLRNNVDWALSRERFWGTPLPIWTCESCARTEAAESVAWLRERGATGFAEGVDEHLQVHRPWVDAITMPCPDCGATMRRVPEVIDCWFDSGAMPFAQWGFPHQGVEEFRRAFPADFISEAIDQTRGWFYSLLMISTMLFDDETCREYGLKPVGLPRPFKSCIVLGHVCDMEGRKESKSKGNYTSPNLVLRGRTRLAFRPDAAVKPGEVGLMKDQVNSIDLAKGEKITLYRESEGERLQATVAVAKVTAKDTVHLNPADLARLGLPEAGGEAWFQMPNEAPGADAFRWLFCSASPPWTNTRLSLRAIRDGQREFLIRLRNVVQFFTIYANIAEEHGQFDVRAGAPRTPAERGELDRWILHQLHATIGEVTERMGSFGLYEASRALSAFVDDLSNWYVRRSRARFWGEGPDTVDALWTLYEVLTTTARLIAPFVPFTAEAIHQALCRGPLGEAAPISVHLASWPEADASLLDPALAADMALARELASLGLSARAASKVKVRQPLAAITVVLADPSREPAARHLAPLLLDELNVRELRFASRAGEFVSFQVKPDFKKLGKSLGADMKRCAAAMGAMDPAAMKAALEAGGLQVDLGDRQITLAPDEVQVTVEAKGGFEAASSAVAVVALHTELDDDLRAEGFVRELVNRVQGLRKELDLGYTERIRLDLAGSDEVIAKVRRFEDYLLQETLTLSVHTEGDVSLLAGRNPEDRQAFEVEVEGEALQIGVYRG